MERSNESNLPILGTFSGECADAEITNENGLDITRPVWENVFNSDIYKEAIKLGHYIGYLGHPEDPNCMNFQHACIVMTEGHIEDDGKVYGTFNLVDTPVGRIVKTFIDAGVTFGISVRGAGDIIDNSVDPDTFVFRGFDLVTFPAYPEAIPEFTEIAASTDSESRLRYKRICSAVESELDSIESCETLSIIQEQFPKQSDTYKELEARKQKISSSTAAQSYSLDDQKISSLVTLYLDEKAKRIEAEKSLSAATKLYESKNLKLARKLASTSRILAEQEKDVNELDTVMSSKIAKLEAKNKTIVHANSSLKKQLHDEKENNLQYHTKIEASDQLLASKDAEIKKLQKKLDKTVIEASNAAEKASKLADKDVTIKKLQDELDKTVIEASNATDRASNLEVENKRLQNEIVASQKLIAEYQDAYASIYSTAVGVDLTNVSVTASTSVADLQKKITGSSAQLAVSEEFVEPQQLDIDDEDDNFLVTI